MSARVMVKSGEPEIGAVPPASPGRPRGGVLLAMALACLLLLAAVVTLSVRVIGAHADRDRNDVVTAIAREVTVRLLTVNPGDARSAMDAVMDQASGNFKQQLIAQNDEFSAAVRQAKVSSEATITESAVQSAGDTQAVLLLTANATVKNAKSPNGEQRQYRIVVELDRTDGPWTVSKLDFAP